MILSICDNGDILNAFRVIKILIRIIKIIVPIILIISLSLKYINAITSNDQNALSKANKNVIPGVVAIAIVFLVPTLITTVAHVTSTDDGWSKCIDNATKEGINAAYIEAANEYINVANKTLNRSDYNVALSEIRKIKNDDEKNLLEGKLAETKKYLDLKDSINRLSNNYNENDYNSLLSQVNAVSNPDAKKILSDLLETAKKNNSTPSSPTQGVPISVEEGVNLKSFTASTGRTIKYVVGAPKNTTSSLPLIVYLHGDGSVGNPNNLLSGEMTAYVKQVYGDNPPFIYLLPNTETTSWTDGNRPASVMELINHIATQYQVNKNKIILSGGSRGAMGAWFIANQYASTFSAFMPISGTGNISAGNFRNLPTKAIVSTDSSDNWCYSNMQSNCSAISSSGGNCQFVPMSGYTHNTILSGAFTKANFEWMISQ